MISPVPRNDTTYIPSAPTQCDNTRVIAAAGYTCSGSSSTQTSQYSEPYIAGNGASCTNTHSVVRTYCDGTLITTVDQIISSQCSQTVTCSLNSRTSWAGPDYPGPNGQTCADTNVHDVYYCTNSTFQTNDYYGGTTCVGGSGENSCGMSDAEYQAKEQECRNQGMILAECQCTYGSPIIVDVDGSGYGLSDLANGVDFDLNADGFAERRPWTVAASTNAFLALDRNRNGVIDNGRELFGNFTPLADGTNAPNGWAALAEFDRQSLGGNGDGVIDQRDAIYSVLLLWQDLNHDGISQPLELHSLASFGIETISIDYKSEMRRDRWGNLFRFKAMVIGHDPVTGRAYQRYAYDVFFDVPHHLSAITTRATAPTAGCVVAGYMPTTTRPAFQPKSALSSLRSEVRRTFR